jgi:ubiquinone biosynthesis protein
MLIRIRRYNQIIQVLAKYELSWILSHVFVKKQVRTTQPQTIVNIFQELGGAFIKLGQVLAMRPDLIGNENAKIFEQLLDKVAEEKITKFPTEFHVHPKPIACGSVAQVYKAQYKNQLVALKMLRPSSKKIFYADIHIIRQIAKIIYAKELLSGIDIRKVVDEFERYTQTELNLTHEAHYTQTFAQYNHPKVHVPKVYAFSPTYIALEYIHGTPILKTTLTTKQKKELAKQLCTYVFEQLFIHRIFHADLHAGNVFVTSQKTLAILDFGIIGQLDAQTGQTVYELFAKLSSGDLDGVAQALIELHMGDTVVDKIQLRQGLLYALGEYYNKEQSEFDLQFALTQLLECAHKSKLELPANLILCIKSLITLEGLIKTLDSTFNVVRVAQTFVGAHKQETIIRTIKQVPMLIYDTLKTVARFQETVEKIRFDIHSASQHIHYSVQMLIKGMIGSALIVASAITTPLSPNIGGYSYVSILCAVAAGYFVYQTLQRGTSNEKTANK